MVDYGDELEGDRSADRRNAERLANVLARWPGDRDQKITFCERWLPGWEAQAIREGFDVEASPKRFAARVRDLAVKYWRTKCKDVQMPSRSAYGPDREKPQMHRGPEPLDGDLQRVLRGIGGGKK